MTGGGGTALAGNAASDAASSQMSDLARLLLALITGGTKPATDVIAALNAAVLDQLPFGDTSDFADAENGAHVDHRSRFTIIEPKG